MAIAYCLNTKRAIYVDWTDTIFSHGAESFYSQFQLVNMPTIQSLDEIPAEASVYPAYWKENMKRPFNQDVFQEHIAMPKDNNLDISKVILSMQDRPEDVLVFSNVGYRTFQDNPEFIANTFRVIDPRIIQKVEERQRKYNLQSAWGIHLRGTDRFPNEARKIQGVQRFIARLVMNGVMSQKNLVVVGDDPFFLNMWSKKFPNQPVLTEKSMLGDSAGVHNLDASKIKASKDEMNVDMFVDFFTLASCAHSLSTSTDSRFANEAARFRRILPRIFGK